MLPALELDGRLITESDVILAELEKAFGPLHTSMHDRHVVELRKLERLLFRAWCGWLCYPSYSEEEERRSQLQFERMALVVDRALAEVSKKRQDTQPFFLGEFSIVDCIFVPYVERMNASLYYYKVRENARKN